MTQRKEVILGGGQRYILTGGEAHLPDCPKAAVRDGAGGYEESLERAVEVGFPPCSECLPPPSPEPKQPRAKARKGRAK